MAKRVMDDKTLDQIFEPLIRDAVAELYGPNQTVATVNRTDLERIMREFAFSVYDQMMKDSEDNDGA